MYFSEYFHLLIKHSKTLFQYIAIHTQKDDRQNIAWYLGDHKKWSYIRT